MLIDVRLLFDGQRIQEDQTAQDLDLEDGDSLEVLLERK
jgi:small ubiquitin-related modifier